MIFWMSVVEQLFEPPGVSGGGAGGTDNGELTWQYGKNMRFAYSGSLRYGGRSGSPPTFCLALFQKWAEERLMRKTRKAGEVRARLRRSRGCKKEKICSVYAIISV